MDLADLSSTRFNFVFSLPSTSSEPYSAVSISLPQTLAQTVNMKWAVLLLLLLAAVAQAGRMPVCAVSLSIPKSRLR